MTTPAPNLGSAPPPPQWALPPPPRQGFSMAPPGMPLAPSDSSSTVIRPNTMPPPGSGSVPLNSHFHPQLGHSSYQSMPPPMAAAPHPPPQGLWLQPPQMGGAPPRLPLNINMQPYHGGPFPVMVPQHVMPPSVHVPDSQPPGVTPLSSAVGIKTDLSSSGDGGNQGTEQSDPWTAHKTETGVVYYYNALTGVSTYDKPPDFKGEDEKIYVQPIPVSMINLLGTDWVLVSTSDGKKYYYNNKTKVSSWQIPNEVTELRKKQDVEIPKEHSLSVPNTNVLAEKESTPVILNAPAINTGGRDAMALRPPNVQGSSSALDLIKKKLQEFGAPVTSSPSPVQSGMASEPNGSKAVDATAKGQLSDNSKDKLKDANGGGNVTDSSSDSEDVDSGPTKEECILQFKEMLKERGVAPFSKWEKELPKIVFDPRFKAIPSYSTRRSLFEHFVKTRVEEERKEKRAAQKAAIEGFKQLLDEASEEIDQKTDYQIFRKKWGDDERFLALDRKDREHLLNERVLPLRKAAEEKAQAIRAATASSFKSLLQEKGDITVNSRWSRVKDSLRDDPRYKSVKHEDREALFNEYLSDLRAVEEESEREAKAKREEQDKLRERERELRKRKEREEQEMERVRIKVRRKEAIVSYQALLVETIKDPQVSWTDAKLKLEKDPQGRAANPELDSSETEKLFREHIRMLNERCAREFKALLAEVLTADAAAQETDDGKTALNSWSTAKRLLKSDPRYNKMPRKDRESLWRRYADDMLRKQKSEKMELDSKDDKKVDHRSRSSGDYGRLSSGLRGSHDRR
ncbi:pre-mRNA-processing protein 40C [Cannabis sativa]|uniref:pre-mRNA-processing protein 40C n=1 Tax=Cannabis sativa TaxID=3483 RepID=UPI0029C9F376|nr:pre-mRNA-processing protein 40C [Cannabis sativa]